MPLAAPAVSPVVSTPHTAASTPTQRFAGKRIHLIGIGGCGMRGLAEILSTKGAILSGSDRVDGSGLQRLRERGVSVSVGQRGENIPANVDTVVYSAAINAENPELLAAKARGVETVKYAAMLGRVMQTAKGIAVCGTHGKSTTTAMVAYTLRQAGLSPSFVVGAQVDQLGGGSGVGMGEHFVAEACEYDRSFLNLAPYYATMLNVEADHLDCYPDIKAIVEAFRAFAGLVPPDGLIVANGEDRNVARAIDGVQCTVQTFGRSEKCHWRAENLVSRRGQFSFDVVLSGTTIARPTMYLPGLHNVYNALACWSICHHAGVGVEALLDSLATFRGARRRLQVKGRAMGVTVVDDYAHHPTEISVTLKAAKEYFQPRRLVCVFQPHQHSRTRHLLEDFAKSFTSADMVLVPDIYFVRDSAEWKDHVSAADLVSKICQYGGEARYLPALGQIEAHLKEHLRDGDLVVTMGAGNIWEVADALTAWLGCQPG